MQTAIYKITSPTNKIYIGQTKNVQKRENDYRKLSCKTQIGIYNSLVKHGWENHKFEIVVFLPPDITPEDLCCQEHAFWFFYKEAGFQMLNLQEPGIHYKHSEETKIKIGLKHLGRKHSEETKLKFSKMRKGVSHKPGRIMPRDYVERMAANLRGKPRPRKYIDNMIAGRIKAVNQYSLQGDFIKTWDSATNAEKFVCNKEKKGYGIVSGCCRGEKSTAYGFKWKYVEN